MKRVRPIIGLNADYRPAGRERPGEVAISDEYLDAITAAGGLPLILPCPPEGAYDRYDIERLLDRCSGLVLIGGDDQDPLHDGFYRHPFTHCMPARRETFDRFLLNEATARKLPLLAIGAGMQMLNVECGGTLVLHIPEERGHSRLHADQNEPNNRHQIEVKPDSLLAEIWGEGEALVTSQHHQAVDDIADGFRLLARAPDGVVEAIQSRDPDWPALGVQWHPESRYASALERQVFEWFLGQVEAKMKNHEFDELHESRRGEERQKYG